MINKELLEELQEILKEEYDLELEEEELQTFGNSLVDYFETLIRIEDNET